MQNFRLLNFIRQMLGTRADQSVDGFQVQFHEPDLIPQDEYTYLDYVISHPSSYVAIRNVRARQEGDIYFLETKDNDSEKWYQSGEYSRHNFDPKPQYASNKPSHFLIPPVPPRTCSNKFPHILENWVVSSATERLANPLGAKAFFKTPTYKKDQPHIVHYECIIRNHDGTTQTHSLRGFEKKRQFILQLKDTKDGQWYEFDREDVAKLLDTADPTSNRIQSSQSRS